MKTIRRKLDEIGGVELNNKQKSQLHGGDELPGFFCISCKNSDGVHLGEVEYEGSEDALAMRDLCISEGYENTAQIAYTRHPCDIQ